MKLVNTSPSGYWALDLGEVKCLPNETNKYEISGLAPWTWIFGFVLKDPPNPQLDGKPEFVRETGVERFRLRVTDSRGKTLVDKTIAPDEDFKVRFDLQGELCRIQEARAWASCEDMRLRLEQGVSYTVELTFLKIQKGKDDGSTRFFLVVP